MCAGAIVLARVDRLVFGAFDPKAGACGSLYEIPTDSRLNHRVEVVGGILAAPCGEILQAFFRGRRARRDSGTEAGSGGRDKNQPV
jgi:tRNA(adenine34) deaminase